MIYLFNEAEYFLIDGAENFGDLILQSEFATEEQKIQVREFQKVLRSLPSGCENFEGKYAVSLHSDDPKFVGFNRRFSVQLIQKEGLCIQSVYRLAPVRNEEVERENQCCFLFRQMERPEASWKAYRRWVHEANMCFSLGMDGQKIDVETSFRVIDPTAKRITIQPDGQDYLWSDEGLVGIDEIAENYPHDLDQDFIDWSCSLERRWPHFDDDFWSHFHKQGIRLGKQLKSYLRKGITLFYRRTPDDYNYREQEYYGI